jgi:GMP synthase-like glutamine amidotransferase
MKTVKIAVLDLYEGHANEGMRCIREIIGQLQNELRYTIHFKEYDVRLKNEVPSLDYDIYISSGGPGSPLESKGMEWDTRFMNWIEEVETWNANPLHIQKKFIFFICHSFQMACRFFKVGQLAKRKSTALGVFPIHMLENADQEPVFQGLNDPFYSVDSRDYQVIQPDNEKLKELGAELLCLEKERPHVNLERAIMAVRFNPYMIGTQFHPEADAQGMSMYLLREDKKNTVIENHGFEKWQSMLDGLKDPDKIKRTYHTVLPNFIKQSISELTNSFSLS